MSGVTALEKTAQRSAGSATLEVSVVIPCLNEAESIETCVVAAARRSLTAATTVRSSSSTTAR